MTFHRLAIPLLACLFWLVPVRALLHAEEGTIDGLNKGVLRLRVDGKRHQAEVRAIMFLDADGKPLDNRGVLRSAKTGTKVDVTIVDGAVTEVRLSSPADKPATQEPPADEPAGSATPSLPALGNVGTFDGLNQGQLRVRVAGKLHRAVASSVKVTDPSGKTLDNRGLLARAKRGAKVDVKIVEGSIVELRFLEPQTESKTEPQPEAKPGPKPTPSEPVAPAGSAAKPQRPKEDRPAKQVQLSANVSQAVLQAALDGTQAGDTIAFQAGTTRIVSPLDIPSGVALVGPAEGTTVLDASAADGPIICKFERLDGITLRGLHFRNIGLEFSGDPSHTVGKDLRVERCRFEDTKRFTARPSMFIRAAYTTNVTIKDCVFLRTAEHHGVGVQFWRAHHSLLEGCRFGEDGPDFPAQKYGHFKTAVYGNGWESDQKGEGARCVDLRIVGNHLRRSPEAAAEEDHGIYVLGTKGLLIEKNDIAGWTTALTGGSIKVRDGENYAVRHNTCADSGILLYNYRNCVYPFENVVVSHNTIRIARQEGESAYEGARGITYWRDDPDSTERSIRIEDNTVENGKIFIHQPVNVADFNADGGGIRRNTADVIVFPQGLAADQNQPRLPDWTPPPRVEPAAAPLTARRPAAGETVGTIDGLNAGVLRVRTSAGVLRLTIQEIKLYADDREVQGRDVFQHFSKRGTKVKLIAKDGQTTELHRIPAPAAEEPE